MNDSIQKNLFNVLLSIPSDPIGKPDSFECLTDVLEILAVVDGLKPSHLNGQGFYSETIQDSLAEIVQQYGLQTLRTKALGAYEFRKPEYEPEIYQWQREQDENERHVKSDVIWIFKDPSLESAIWDTVNGHRNESLCLGYPECCIVYHHEIGLQLREGLVRGIKQTYRTNTVSEVIEHLRNDSGVTIEDFNFPEESDRSHGLFPYVQFSACPPCMKSSTSPAARINKSMRDLAFKVSSAFGVKIWQEIYKQRWPDKLKALGRNDICPCGSGKKYKKCCIDK